MRLTAYDFETTGVDPHTCEPVQYAAIVVDIADNGEYTVIDQSKEYFKIQAPEVPEGAFNVHGINKRVTENLGVDPYVVLPSISGTVLGYNNQRYDDVILTRYGGDIQSSVDIFKAVSRINVKSKFRSRKLSDVFEALTGRRADNAHDALADVVMTLDLIRPIMWELETKTFKDLVNLINKPLADVHMHMPFGKYKGVKLSEVVVTDRKYLEWLNRGDIWNKDLKNSIKAALEKY